MHRWNSLLLDGQQFARLDRDDACRTRTAVDQTHLAEEFTRAKPGENDLAAFLVGIGHLGATGKQDDQRLGIFAGAHHLLRCARHARRHRHLRQALEFASHRDRKRAARCAEPPDSGRQEVADIKQFPFMELRTDYKLNSQIS
jgi:hypothetical protein